MTTRSDLMTAIGVLGARTFVLGARVDSLAACADAEKKPPMNGDYGTKYNAEAVQKEINKDKRIKPGEAKLIHGLLKGWRGDGAKADTSEITKASVKNMEKDKLMAVLKSTLATPSEKKIVERELDDRANRGL